MPCFPTPSLYPRLKLKIMAVYLEKNLNGTVSWLVEDRQAKKKKSFKSLIFQFF